LIGQVAQFAERVRRTGLPEARRRRTTQRVLDVVGNCLAASQQEIGEIVRSVVDCWGGREAASVVGRTRRYPASGAALVNRTLSQALDFDDTHLPSVLHPSSSVVPAALAAAEATATRHVPATRPGAARHTVRRSRGPAEARANPEDAAGCRHA